MTRRFTLLRAERVSFGYRPGIPALRDVSIDVDEHEIVTILGSNGAGKSTLLRVIAGLECPWSGSITYQGENVECLRAHELADRGLTMVPSDRAIFDDQTLMENLLLGVYQQRHSRSRVSRTIDAIARRYPDLAARAQDVSGHLSGGQLRQLAFARAEASRPRLLLLDEPTAGLSPKAAHAITRRIEELRDAGITILMVEKRPLSVKRLSDRVFVMDRGRVVLGGTSDEVLSDSRLAGYFLGDR